MKYTIKKSVSSRKPLYFIERNGKYFGFSKSKERATLRVNSLNKKPVKNPIKRLTRLVS